MMNLHTMRTRAEQRQRAAHQNRAFHREQQKAAEREDQDCKKVIKGIDGLLSAQSAMASIFSEVSADLLAAIGAESSPTPAPVDDGTDAVSPKRRVVSGRGDADRVADEGYAPLRHDEDAVLPDTRAEHRDAGDAEDTERPVPEPAGAASSVHDDTSDTDEGHAAKTSRFLSLDLIHELADLWEEGKTVAEMAEAKGVTKGTVSGLAHRRRDLFPKREPVPFKPKPKPAQSPMVERLVPRPVPAPYNPIAIGNVREIAPLMNEMRAFFAKCEAKSPGGGIHEVASLEIRFNTTDLRIERALRALAGAGEIEWSASLKGHVTVRALRKIEAAE